MILNIKEKLKLNIDSLNRFRKSGIIIWHIVKYIGITLFIFIVSFIVFSKLFPGKGYEIFIVRSGSMEPVIPVGGIVITYPTRDYNVGDIIVFHNPNKTSEIITHRIIEKINERAVKTKGDANDSVDITAIPTFLIRGEVVLIIPIIGYILHFVRQPLGLFIFFGIPVLILLWDTYEKSNKIKRYEKEQNEKNINPTSLKVEEKKVKIKGKEKRLITKNNNKKRSKKRITKKPQNTKKT